MSVFKITTRLLNHLSDNTEQLNFFPQEYSTFCFIFQNKIFVLLDELNKTSWLEEFEALHNHNLL